MGNKDYTIRQLMEIEACTNCRMCADVCPAVTASGRGDLSGIYRIRGLKDLLRGRTRLFGVLPGKKPLTGEEFKKFSDSVFECTLCGNCQEICPVGINLKDLWLSLRVDLFHSGLYPKKVEMIRDNLEETCNVFGEDNDERVDWVEDMREAPDHGYIKDRADIVYFTGCVSSYFPMAQKIPVALVRIMEASGADFTLLGEEEHCCGFPLLGAGLKDMADRFIEHNMEAVKKKGAQKVLFSCPSCYQMWKEYYPPEIEPIHVTEYLNGLIKEGKIPLRELPLTVTYHDPCDLGRGSRVFEEPREIIGSIPGIRFVELPRNRENCRCCGGGGNLEMIDPDLSAEISRLKIEEILDTGAQAVVTSCQQCVRTMAGYVRRNKIPLEVLDITQLVDRALAESPSP